MIVLCAHTWSYDGICWLFMAINGWHSVRIVQLLIMYCHTWPIYGHTYLYKLISFFAELSVANYAFWSGIDASEWCLGEQNLKCYYNIMMLPSVCFWVEELTSTKVEPIYEIHASNTESALTALGRHQVNTKPILFHVRRLLTRARPSLNRY